MGGSRPEGAGFNVVRLSMQAAIAALSSMLRACGLIWLRASVVMPSKGVALHFRKFP